MRPVAANDAGALRIRVVDDGGRALRLSVRRDDGRVLSAPRKLAVEVHGGRVWVEDADPGAVFCITLPHDR
jgi:hypothetical protein